MSKNVNKKNEEKLKIYLAKIVKHDIKPGNKTNRITGVKS